MLTTFHTPPLSWLEVAIGAAGGNGSAFAAVSRHTATAWERVLNRVLVVPNGVDVDRWPAGSGGPYLVWSGRITPEKGAQLAIEAARRAGMPLRLAGPVEDPDYFREQIQPHLCETTIYEGHLDQGDLAVLVGGAAAALVTPLWDEPYGLVVAEAMACGTPVVAFARGGIPEVVDARSGRLVKPHDVAAMAAAIPHAIGLSRNEVRARAVAACSAQTMVASYLSIYRHLIEEQDGAVDDRLLRAPSGPWSSRQSIEHLRTPA
jgi:glycosyltransferase involved in cell wall biosynthesis